jgi:hypothetical protein
MISSVGQSTRKVISATLFRTAGTLRRICKEAIEDVRFEIVPRPNTNNSGA